MPAIFLPGGMWIGKDGFIHSVLERQFVPTVPSAELMDLTRRAVVSCDARKNEDIHAWAARLAAAVADAND